MIIAIASDGELVSNHFGHCKEFVIYNVVNNLVLDKQYIANPGHRPGFLPLFIKDLGAKVIIAGGMGATAQELFFESGIEVFVGIQGNCDNIVEEFVKGNIISTGGVCNEHAHQCFLTNRSVI